MAKDASVIPPGCYCYTYDLTGKAVVCPYWDLREDKPEQENGYCAFMEQGDWDSEHLSLLWDQVKECGVNMDDEDECI